MSRTTLPDGHNNTTARFARQLHCNRICDAETACTVFREVDVCEYGALWWAVMTVLAIVAAVVIVATA